MPLGALPRVALPPPAPPAPTAVNKGAYPRPIKARDITPPPRGAGHAPRAKGRAREVEGTRPVCDTLRRRDGLTPLARPRPYRGAGPPKGRPRVAGAPLAAPLALPRHRAAKTRALSRRGLPTLGRGQGPRLRRATTGRTGQRTASARPVSAAAGPVGPAVRPMDRVGRVDARAATPYPDLLEDATPVWLRVRPPLDVGPPRLRPQTLNGHSRPSKRAPRRLRARATCHECFFATNASCHKWPRAPKSARARVFAFRLLRLVLLPPTTAPSPPTQDTAPPGPAYVTTMLLRRWPVRGGPARAPMTRQGQTPIARAMTASLPRAAPVIQPTPPVVHATQGPLDGRRYAPSRPLIAPRPFDKRRPRPKPLAPRLLALSGPTLGVRPVGPRPDPTRPGLLTIVTPTVPAGQPVARRPPLGALPALPLLIGGHRRGPRPAPGAPGAHASPSGRRATHPAPAASGRASRALIAWHLYTDKYTWTFDSKGVLKSGNCATGS